MALVLTAYAVVRNYYPQGRHVGVGESACAVGTVVKPSTSTASMSFFINLSLQTKKGLSVDSSFNRCRIAYKISSGTRLRITLEPRPTANSALEIRALVGNQDIPLDFACGDF
jgi:hypothetical protein